MVFLLKCRFSKFRSILNFFLLHYATETWILILLLEFYILKFLFFVKSEHLFHYKSGLSHFPRCCFLLAPFGETIFSYLEKFLQPSQIETPPPFLCCQHDAREQQ